jgi:hypothetical protein
MPDGRDLVVPAAEPGPSIRAFAPVFDGLCGAAEWRGHGVLDPCFRRDDRGGMGAIKSRGEPDRLPPAQHARIR